MIVGWRPHALSRTAVNWFGRGTYTRPSNCGYSCLSADDILAYRLLCHERRTCIAQGTILFMTG